MKFSSNLILFCQIFFLKISPKKDFNLFWKNLLENFPPKTVTCFWNFLPFLNFPKKTLFFFFGKIFFQIFPQKTFNYFWPFLLKVSKKKICVLGKQTPLTLLCIYWSLMSEIYIRICWSISEKTWFECEKSSFWENCNQSHMRMVEMWW